jgi:hypothetical protein
MSIPDLAGWFQYSIMIERTHRAFVCRRKYNRKIPWYPYNENLPTCYLNHWPYVSSPGILPYKIREFAPPLFFVFITLFFKITKRIKSNSDQKTYYTTKNYTAHTFYCDMPCTAFPLFMNHDNDYRGEGST